MKTLLILAFIVIVLGIVYFVRKRNTARKGDTYTLW